jgi:hypothetical protein
MLSLCRHATVYACWIVIDLHVASREGRHRRDKGEKRWVRVRGVQTILSSWSPTERRHCISRVTHLRTNIFVDQVALKITYDSYSAFNVQTTCLTPPRAF